VTQETPRFIFFGNLQRDFMILPDGKTLLDVPGGNLLYAAVGLGAGPAAWVGGACG
jgi:hypothetical protein